jgi:hypothetical protein
MASGGTDGVGSAAPAFGGYGFYDSSMVIEERLVGKLISISSMAIELMVYSFRLFLTSKD